MEFFKSAVASMAKGPAFGYTFGERMDIDQSIWTLHHGTKREDGSKCSILSFDINANRARLPLARNALRKFKTLRHPGVVKILDTIETDQFIYIATEPITPLNWATKRKALSEESLKWGLHNVAKTLKFINDEAASVHGNIRASSIYTSDSGEWKIGGLEILSSMKEDDAVIFTQGSLVPDIGRYSPPEVVKGGWESVRKNPTHAIDAYCFGILISEVFSGGFSGSEQIGTTKNVPHEMQTSYKRLTHAMPKMRLSVGHFLEQGSRSGGFFDTPLIQLTDGIDNLGLKNDAEKDEFLTELATVAESDDFPEEFFKVKVLPELLKSVEFGGGGPKSLALVMRIAEKLTDEEYNARITPVIVRLFTIPDRAMRVCLLDNLPHMIDHLSQKLVTDKIFPQMVTGFGDLAPIVREQTVKAVLVVVPKLSDRVINGELLRHLAKTANDDQPGIRTNTTICLGKIARNLGPGTRTKVLTAAFCRSLRDPFVHARNAALMALAATVDVFGDDDCATKLLPSICPLLVDKERIIRDQANKTLNVYLERVRKYSLTLPDTILPPPESASAGGTRVNSPQPNAAAGGVQAGSQWMGWAISSFTNKLGTATGEMQSEGTANTAIRPDLNRSSSTPSTTAVKTSLPSSVRASHLAHNNSSPALPKVSSSLRNTTTSAATTPVVEDEDFGADAWGELGDDETNNNGDDDDDGPSADAWDTPLTSSHASAAATPKVNYDDGGEPDFEGWLNAQNSNKSATGKRPLPKGLAKKTPSTSAATISTSRPVSSKPIFASAKKPPVVKKEVAAPAPAKEEQTEDWGDAWD